ncbi:MAG: hypothetical protein JW841_07800 [Deltaproteobacteria bacterium]|nr:hypothetical protein [Deltaproteobacteria bacterium]
MRPILLVGIIVVIIALAALLIGRISFSDQLEHPSVAVVKANTVRRNIAASTEGQSRQLAQLRAQLNQLRQTQQELTDQVARLERNEKQADGSLAKQQDEPEQGETSMAVAAAKALDTKDRLEQTLALQPADSDWVVEAEDGLRAGVGRILPGASVVDVDCRATFCRLELAFADMQMLEQGLDALPTVSPWNGGGFFHVDGGDSLKAVAFIARKGMALPR